MNIIDETVCRTRKVTCGDIPIGDVFQDFHGDICIMGADQWPSGNNTGRYAFNTRTNKSRRYENSEEFAMWLPDAKLYTGKEGQLSTTEGPGDG